ncbi:MAG TPA: peptidoglycan DD-metalloendopeptidase family protein [Mycobacteriales bacterium]|jgi:murein DD-endopeptidase MepM/ murein hydrolase activator NlpD
MPLLLALLALLVLPGLPASADGGRWVAPLDGPLVVRRGFDPPEVRWGAGHRGVDLASYDGAVVRAAGAGTVTYAGTLALRGVLVVTHGALRTTYEPVTPLVAVGTAVAVGEEVALLDAGHEGTTSPDGLLHWGLLRGEEYLDPLRLLAGPSRLVPVPPADPAPQAAASGPAAPAAGAAHLATVPPPAPPRPPAPAAPRPRGIAAVARAAPVAVLGLAALSGRRRARRSAPARASP